MKPLILSSLILLSGCSTLSLTVHTQPIGAQVSDPATGQIHGMTPVTLTFDGVDMESFKDEAGCYRVAPLRLQWVSGVWTETEVITLCHGNQAHNVTVQRPDADGLGTDMQFAVQVENLAVQKRQAGAQELGAGAQIWNAWSNSQQATQNCVTRAVGDTVRTQCW